MSRERLLLLISLAVIIAGALWWALRGEYEDRSIYRPSEVRLMTEKYYLAGEWLGQRKLWVRSLNRLDDLFVYTASGQTLLLHGTLGQHNELEQRRLEQWVLNGGRLLAEAPPAFRSVDTATTLNPYGIRSCRFCREDFDEDDEADSDDDADEKDRPAQRELNLPDGQTLTIRDRSRLLADDAPHDLVYWYDQEGQAMVIRYPVGDGEVVLLSNSAWFDNRSLVYPDHARLLLALLGDGPQQILLQQRDIRGGLLGWLWQQAPLLWSVAILLLALAIWRRLPRLGPIRAADTRQTRQMREHLLATARFDWRHNRGQNLLAALREEGIAHIVQRCPDWHQLAPQVRLDRLRSLYPELTRESLAWYLSLGETDQAEEFIRYVQLHHQLLQTRQER